MQGEHEVRLAVPAEPGYLRLARVTASGLASRLGFSIDEVEDLRLAIDELCFGLIGPYGRPGTVDLRYGVQPDGLVVEGVAHFADEGDPPALGELSELILDALVDEHELSNDGGAPRFRLRKLRRGA